VRGFGRFRNNLHRPNPLNLSFSPLGRRDAACTPRLRLTARTASVTPAMAADVTDHVWSVADVVAIIKATEAAPAKRGPYKKRVTE